jgi:ribosome-binding factor A
VEEQLANVLSTLIRERLDDPRAGGLSITRVELRDDLKTGVAYVSTLIEADEDAGLAAVRKASGFLLGEAGRAMRLRHAPRLEFERDRRVSASAHIESLLDGSTEGSTDGSTDGDPA